MKKTANETPASLQVYTPPYTYHRSIYKSSLVCSSNAWAMLCNVGSKCAYVRTRQRLTVIQVTRKRSGSEVSGCGIQLRLRRRGFKGRIFNFVCVSFAVQRAFAFRVCLLEARKKMPKHDFLSPKAISNRIKSKGLQKLRWYCQMCQKQCRDEVR